MSFEQALLISLLSGVAAGFVAILANLAIQARSHRYQDEHRFTDLKRERYAELLRLADEYADLIRQQRTNLWDHLERGVTPSGLPALPPTTRVEQIAIETELLTKDKDVHETANLMASSVIAFSAYAYDATDRTPPGDWLVDTAEAANDKEIEYVACRAKFVRAAKKDVGLK